MAIQIRRREFITLGGAVVALPLAARAQQPAVPVIGFLGTERPESAADRLPAFGQGLSETGDVEGRNVKIEYRWAADQNARFASLATDLERFSLMLTRSLRVGGNWRILSDKLCVGANESCARGPVSFAQPLFAAVL